MAETTKTNIEEVVEEVIETVDETEVAEENFEIEEEEVEMKESIFKKAGKWAVNHKKGLAIGALATTAILGLAKVVSGASGDDIEDFEDDFDEVVDGSIDVETF